jgi:hypothetical protein
VEELSCRAVDDLLDGLVRVWLGIARELDAAGSRIVLVAAAPRRIVQPYRGRSSSDALRLGARAAWQTELPLTGLLDARAKRQIVVSCRPRRLPADNVTWIAVPEGAWTRIEPLLPPVASISLPFPSGSHDNWHHRVRRERRRIEQMWLDRTLFSQIALWTHAVGDYVAKPDGDRIALAVLR